MPRTLHPAEIRVLRRLSYIPTGSLSDLATAAMISPKAISRVWNSLHHMRLVHFYDDAAGSFVRGLTDAGRAELGKWGWRVESAHIPMEVARAQQLPQEPTPAVEPATKLPLKEVLDVANAPQRAAVARHAPTPWHARSGEIHAVLPGHTYIADCWHFVPRCGAKTVEEAEANAAFIVRAVNAHDALVSALIFYADAANWKELRTGIGSLPSEADKDGGSRASEALKLVKVQP